MLKQTRTVLQPTLWLSFGTPVLRPEIIMPERLWLRNAPGTLVGGIMVTTHHISSGSLLIFEGSRTGESFTTLTTIDGSTFVSTDNKFTPIALSANYPLSDGSQHMWPLVRWRWAPVSGGTLANQSVCFEAQVVVKS